MNASAVMRGTTAEKGDYRLFMSVGKISVNMGGYNMGIFWIAFWTVLSFSISPLLGVFYLVLLFLTAIFSD